MTIVFTNPKKPDSLDELSERQQQQLARLGELYDGVSLSAAERLSPERAEDEDLDEGVSFYGMIELWEVHEEGAHRYNALLVMADSGALFEKDSTELVIERIQASFGGGGGSRSDDDDFEDALDKAYREAKKKFAAQLKSKASGPWAAYEKALAHIEEDVSAKKPASPKKATAKTPSKKKPAPKKTPSKKPATKKTTAKKAAKPAAKKIAAKKTPSKKPATAKKIAAKKPAAKKPTAKKKATKKK